MPQKICCEARQLIETKPSSFSGSYYSSFKLFQSNIEQNQSIIRKVDNSISNVSMEIMFKINDNRNDNIKPQFLQQSFIFLPSSEIIDVYIGDTQSNLQIQDKKIKLNISSKTQIKQYLDQQLINKEQSKTFTIKKKNLKKSNALKNFANQFVVYFSDIQNIQNILKKYYVNSNQYKNILDNLKKKIKYLKRAQKIQDIKSMLQHSIPDYQNILIESCELFLQIYPKKVQQSLKMKDTHGNLTIINVISNLITQMRNE